MKDDKKNLMIIVPNLQLGGQERMAIKTAELLKDTYNVIMVIFDNSNSVYKTDCNVVNINVPTKSLKFQKVINVLKRKYLVAKLKEEYEISFTFSFGSTANLINVLTRKNDKIFTSVRGFLSIKTSLACKYIFNKSDVVITISKLLSNKILELYPKCKVETLYNSFNINELDKMAEEEITDYEFCENTIISHGRLNEIKNLPRLIKAFSIVKQSIENARLLLIGEGQNRKELEKLVEKYNLSDAITIIGFRDNPYKYIGKSKLYVLSSFSEGFCCALVEGMAFIPAISVDCKAGPREIMSDGDINKVTESIEYAEYGILVKPMENRKIIDEIIPEDEILAKSIIDILTNDNRYNEYKIKARCRAKEFSDDRYKKSIINILEK